VCGLLFHDCWLSVGTNVTLQFRALRPTCAQSYSLGWLVECFSVLLNGVRWQYCACWQTTYQCWPVLGLALLSGRPTFVMSCRPLIWSHDKVIVSLEKMFLVDHPLSTKPVLLRVSPAHNLGVMNAIQMNYSFFSEFRTLDYNGWPITPLLLETVLRVWCIEWFISPWVLATFECGCGFRPSLASVVFKVDPRNSLNVKYWTRLDPRNISVWLRVYTISWMW